MHNAVDMTPPPVLSDAVTIELNAVLVALTENQPLVLTLEDGTLLPSGPFATEHPTLQIGVRAWVERQTQHPLGYVEQLYTFADRNRPASDGQRRVVSISYLGLTRERLSAGARDPEWRSWYRYFPWEDWRSGPSPLVAETILPQLAAWADAVSDPVLQRERRRRIEVRFGDGTENWNEELILQRRPGARSATGDGPRGAGDGDERAARPSAGHADAARPSPHPRHRHRAAARQDQIPAGVLRADAT